jgi:hypothetical protein
MNLRNLTITFLLATAPLAQAGRTEDCINWFKNNMGKVIIGSAAIATGTYYTLTKNTHDTTHDASFPPYTSKRHQDLSGHGEIVNSENHSPKETDDSTQSHTSLQRYLVIDTKNPQNVDINLNNRSNNKSKLDTKQDLILALSNASSSADTIKRIYSTNKALCDANGFSLENKAIRRDKMKEYNNEIISKTNAFLDANDN